MTQYLQRRLVAYFALLIGLGAALFPFSSSANVRDEIEWDEPVAMAHELHSSWFPEIDADQVGTVRLTWEATLVPGEQRGEQIVNEKSAVMISQLRGAGWSKPADIQMTAGNGKSAGRPTIVNDGEWAHILFNRDLPSGPVRLWYMRAPLTSDLTNAHSWSEPRALSTAQGYYAQLVVLPGGELVAVYNQVASVQVNPDKINVTSVYARRSTDRGKTWGAPVRVSDTTERVARTSVALSPDRATLIAIWDEGYDNVTGRGQSAGVGTATSTDGGRTWHSHQAIRSPLGPIEQGFVAFGAAGPLLAYRSTVSDQLLYRSGNRSGREWGEERPIPDVVLRRFTTQHHFDRFSVAADAAGRLLLAYVGQDASAPKGLAVWVVTYADGRWSPPQRVAAPDGLPEYPRLTVALGNQLHLVFFLRDGSVSDDPQRHYTLWSVAGRSDAPAIAPVPLPTKAPERPVVTRATVSAARLQTPVPAPTPHPPLAATAETPTPQSMVTDPAVRIVQLTAAALLALFALGVLRRVLSLLRA